MKAMIMLPSESKERGSKASEARSYYNAKGIAQEKGNAHYQMPCKHGI